MQNICGNGVEKKSCHSLIYRVIKIYFVQKEFYIITETNITEIWTDKWILTFPIQVLKFSVSSLEIANFL